MINHHGEGQILFRSRSHIFQDVLCNKISVTQQMFRFSDSLFTESAKPKEPCQLGCKKVTFVCKNGTHVYSMYTLGLGLERLGYITLFVLFQRLFSSRVGSLSLNMHFPFLFDSTGLTFACLILE